MEKYTICLLMIALLTSCATMDSALSTRGIINSSTSKMDGNRIVRMSPVLSKHGMTDIQAEFGLYWDSKKGEEALFSVNIAGAENFDPMKPFEIKIDGELLQLPPASKSDYGDVETIAGYNSSSKDYIVHKIQILKIANGKQATYRIWFLKGQYAEGEVTYEYQNFQSYVPFSFKEFYAKVWK